MLQMGDVIASRLLYQRVAESGDGAAAFKLAQTYDPVFLTLHNLQDIRSDPVAAEQWYRKASALGDVNAAKGLKGLADRQLVDASAKR